MNILDIIVILILLAFIIKGYFKGLVSSILEIFGFLIGIFIFKFLYPIFNNLLLNSSLYGKLKDWIILKLNLKDVNVASELLNNFNLPDFMNQQILQITGLDSAVNTTIDNILSYLATVICSIIMGIITILISIILSTIIIKILSDFTKIFTKAPIINKVNKIFGVLLGLFIGLIIIWILGIIMLVLGFFPDFSNLNDLIKSSLIAKPILENNYLLDSLLNLLKNMIIK